MGFLFSEPCLRHGGVEGGYISPVIKKWAPRVIGPIVLLILLLQLDIRATIEVLRQASLKPIVFAYLMFIPSLFFRTIRWRILMAPQRIHLRFCESFSVYALSIFVGVVTPGRLGEFIKAVYLKQKGNSLGASFFSVFLDRIYDIVFLLIFGCGALSSFVLFGEETATVIAWIFFGVAFSVVILWFMARGKGHETVIRILRAVSPSSLKARITSGYLDFSEGFGKTKLVTFGWAFVLTCLAWGANYGAVYLFGVALGFDITFLVMAGIAAICALVTMIPISIMGLGTRDAALILMLGKYGVSETGAVAFSTLILSMLLCNAALCSFSLLTPAGKFDWRVQVGDAFKQSPDNC